MLRLTCLKLVSLFLTIINHNYGTSTTASRFPPSLHLKTMDSLVHYNQGSILTESSSLPGIKTTTRMTTATFVDGSSLVNVTTEEDEKENGGEEEEKEGGKLKIMGKPGEGESGDYGIKESGYEIKERGVEEDEGEEREKEELITKNFMLETDDSNGFLQFTVIRESDENESETNSFSRVNSKRSIQTKDYLLSNATYLLDSLLSKSNYDKKLRPGFGGPPLVIYTDIEIRSFGPISENEMVYSIDCYFRQTWHDTRLKFGENVASTIFNDNSLNVLSMDWKFLQKVWTPDTYFTNGRNSYMHKVTTPNKFIRLREDGQLWYSMRLTIKAGCPMHLRKYPLDIQSCPLEIGSFAYGSRDVIYKWKGEHPVVMHYGVTLSQYQIINVTTANKSDDIPSNPLKSAISVRFLLQRRRGYFILQIYAPCAMIVGASWVSFWINKNDAAARVAVGATTVLTLVTMGFGGKSTLPRVAYATALDWFVVMCFTFVFAAMVEYACVNFLDRKQAEKITEILTRKLNQQCEKETNAEEGSNMEPDCQKQLDSLVEAQTDEQAEQEEEESTKEIEKRDFECQVNVKKESRVMQAFRSLRRQSSYSTRTEDLSIESLVALEPTRGGVLDSYARVGFPLAFTILNGIYWVFFLYKTDDQIQNGLKTSLDIPTTLQRTF